MRKACVVCGKVTEDGWRCAKHQFNAGTRPKRNRPRRNGSTRAYRKAREIVLERDGHRCTECGSTVELRVDHIKPVEYGGTDDPLNLVTRCKLCHDERHGATPRETKVLTGPLELVARLVPPQQLIALCGPPASGKTTVAEALAIPSVSVDEYRHGDFTRAGTSRAFGQAYERTAEIMRTGQSVLFDSTAVTLRSRDSLRRFGRSMHVATSLVVFDVPLAELLERNSRRADPVPEQLVAHMHDDFLRAKDTIEREGFRSVVHLAQGGG